LELLSEVPERGGALDIAATAYEEIHADPGTDA
jgi:hypothetical protein